MWLRIQAFRSFSRERTFNIFHRACFNDWLNITLLNIEWTWTSFWTLIDREHFNLRTVKLQPDIERTLNFSDLLKIVFIYFLLLFSNSELRSSNIIQISLQSFICNSSQYHCNKIFQKLACFVEIRCSLKMFLKQCMNIERTLNMFNFWQSNLNIKFFLWLNIFRKKLDG